ncbi:MAG: hybrid sensor histidine kinase/response regulator, partial [Rhodoferax sp.]|nr:hybrid sensor histidine kinase/response regulator [Rhodoferax sp.]
MKFWFKRRPSVAFWLSLAVFAAGTSLAVASAFWLNQRQIAQAQKDYQQNVDSAVEEITTHLMQPVRGLNGLLAMYAARYDVTRSKFTAHVFSRDLPVEFPGVRGFGFIERVDRDAVDAFLERVQADEAPEFALRLLDAPSDPHYVITYIEPLIDNAGAQGLDVGSEARRRSAIEQA